MHLNFTLYFFSSCLIFSDYQTLVATCFIDFLFFVSFPWEYRMSLSFHLQIRCSISRSPSTFSHTCFLKLDVSYEFEIFKGGHSLLAFGNPECEQYWVNFHPSCKFLILWRSTNGLNLPPYALTSSIFNHQEK